MEIENNNEVELLGVDDLDDKIMTFFIEGVLYGLELKNVKEIVTMQYITKVPNVPEYVCGIINLRGKIVPVIETRLKLDNEFKEYDDKTCIIVVEQDDSQIGLVVDEVNEVMRLSNGTDIPAKREQKEKKYLKSITKINDRMVLNLDLNFFINDDNNEPEN